MYLNNPDSLFSYLYCSSLSSLTLVASTGINRLLITVHICIPRFSWKDLAFVPYIWKLYTDIPNQLIANYRKEWEISNYKSIIIQCSCTLIRSLWIFHSALIWIIVWHTGCIGRNVWYRLLITNYYKWKWNLFSLFLRTYQEIVLEGKWAGRRL